MLPLAIDWQMKSHEILLVAHELSVGTCRVDYVRIQGVEDRLYHSRDADNPLAYRRWLNCHDGTSGAVRESQKSVIGVC